MPLTDFIIFLVNVAGHMVSPPASDLFPLRFYSQASQSLCRILVLLHIVGALAIYLITPHRILQFFQDLSGWLRDQGSFGALLIVLAASTSSFRYSKALSLTLTLLRRWFSTVATSHPPLFGFATSLTMIGFTFGMWPGALLAFFGSMVGSAFAFWSIRVRGVCCS